MFVPHASKKIRNQVSSPINTIQVIFFRQTPDTCATLSYLHLCHVDWLVDEYPRGCLIAGRNGDGALVGDITCGVGVEVSYVQTHQ